jgi:hypothetical protein
MAICSAFHGSDTTTRLLIWSCADSVLILYPLYNGDITLRMYLVAAMDNGMIYRIQPDSCD